MESTKTMIDTFRIGVSGQVEMLWEFSKHVNKREGVSTGVEILNLLKDINI